MSFDPMATAVDWLDAYRAGDIDAILAMYSDDVVVECHCSDLTIIGKEGLRAYWEQRFKDCAPSDLDDLQPFGDGVTISYIARGSVVAAALQFNADGRITLLRCRPSQEAAN